MYCKQIFLDQTALIKHIAFPVLSDLVQELRETDRVYFSSGWGTYKHACLSHSLRVHIKLSYQKKIS